MVENFSSASKLLYILELTPLMLFIFSPFFADFNEPIPNRDRVSYRYHSRKLFDYNSDLCWLKLTGSILK